MKRPLKTLTLFSVFCVAILLTSCGGNNKMQVTFVNQTSLPVNMYVSGDMCTNENMVWDKGMRKDKFQLNGNKNAEEFEVAVNNQVLVRKSLQWEKDAKEIVVVYNGSDLIVSK
jgi:hypothetical protein